MRSRRKTKQIIAGLCIALAVLIPLRIAQGSPSPARHRAVQIRSDQWRRLNDERHARGLPYLIWNGKLSGRSAVWSKHMYMNRTISHTDLGPLLVTYDYVGENVATGSRGTRSGQLGVAFMHSQGHRDDLLSPGFTSAGIGVFCAPDHSMWITVEFGRRWSEGQPPTYSGGTPALPIARPDAGPVRC